MNQKKDYLKQRYQEMLLEKQKADKNPNEVEKQKKRLDEKLIILLKTL